ncbi:hypothetical protein E1B28_001943 [Marasmius oreades]|uniref:C2H2-type domain-containing protein n=1 Tax=Marasmius oreades TaxID=181124 RepID=A0A9P7V4I4_9AGAR|nr:uncharacterized protein E1B28_001943 [Marasmius oreades]KAG7100163.1 hypothetical protein E1B28_001943 [Marasmius oreades]
MVSVRKLKQMEQNGDLGPHDNGNDSGVESIGEEASSSKISPKDTQDTDIKRPYTRSQSGRTIKRRIRDDNALDPDSQSSSPIKRAKLSRKRPIRKPQPKEVESEDNSTSESEEPGAIKSAINTAGGGELSAPPIMPEEHSQSEQTMVAPSLPMRYGTNRVMRATLPTPVPNLTKKSRGRRVPTRAVAELPVSERIDDKRSYVCSVEGCGKCFHRGEHLKRHIRSIHTHEKPFKCTFANCEKYFNRHDNLLQHIKVHKQHVVSKSPRDEESGDESNVIVNASSKGNIMHSSHPLLSLAAAAARPLKPASTIPNLNPVVSDSGYSSTSTLTSSASSLFPSLRQTYTQMSFSSGTSPYESSGNSNTFSTNMAVSSLRTEMSSLRTEMPESFPKQDDVNETPGGTYRFVQQKPPYLPRPPMML